MKDFFEQDLADASGVNVNLARAIYRHCTNVLKARPYAIASRHKSDGGGPRHTIFNDATTDHYFLVLNLRKTQPFELAFPDKDDRIHELGAQWAPRGQGRNGKKEKRIELSDDDSLNYQAAVLALIDRIHANAIEYYLRQQKK